MKKLDLPSPVLPINSQGTLCVHPSLPLDIYHSNDLLTHLSPPNPSSQGQCPVYHCQPSAGTEEINNHVYEMNKQVNEEQSASLPE